MPGAGYSRTIKIKPRLRTEQVVISQVLPPMTGIRIERPIPVNGTITSIVLHFPGGCNALVDVSVGHGVKQMCPSTGVIALDAATPMIPTSERVETSEVLWAVIANGDMVNPHTITVIATIEA